MDTGEVGCDLGSYVVWVVDCVMWGVSLGDVVLVECLIFGSVEWFCGMLGGADSLENE